MEDLANAVRIEICKADPATRARAWQLQREHKMRSFDAVHAATCIGHGIKDIVCFDDDFHAPLPDASFWTSSDQLPRWKAKLEMEAKRAAEAAAEAAEKDSA